ncbi:MAG: KpsF/GutQ family sugar-phosphate isomerase [Deltaproteobacteria bacterium]|nr:KpsF/GutQ family sugar-phosphate isomerase [Deltaproteobacteria bacterium]
MKKAASLRSSRKSKGSPVLERARRVLETEAEAVRALAERVGAELERAVELLAETAGKVVVTGLGKSGIIARKIAATLASTGTPAFFVHAGEGVHGDLGMVVKGDSVVAVSYSGETREILAMLPLFKRLGLPLVTLTGVLDSTLAKSADVALDVSVREEACPLALAPTASTTAALAMGDALALVLMERRGFREEDFAFLHPAGSLGRKLARVADLMHRGEEMPLVAESASLREAIHEMTAKRLGHAGVVSSAGKLVGVLSDGDLRRALERGAVMLDLAVREVLRRDPRTVREHALRAGAGVITVGEQALGAEALAVMERHAITALFIIDERGRPRGIVHLHDLLKAGVV